MNFEFKNFLTSFEYEVVYERKKSLHTFLRNYNRNYFMQIVLKSLLHNFMSNLIT